jgi:hypothetical protein
MANDATKHRAVIAIQAQLHEVMPGGECSADAVMTIPQFFVSFESVDRFIAQRRLNELLAEVKKQCQ